MKVEVNQLVNTTVGEADIKKIFRSISRLRPRFRFCLISVAIVGSREIRRLNRRYRGKDQPTDVLSFPSQSGPMTQNTGGDLGEIIICDPAARRQARAGHWPVSEEYARLLVHGWLHLVGYDHHHRPDKTKMNRWEKKILSELNVSYTI